ncbi:MAG: response regulator [Candidatus Omnitrophota bacterium]|jgi:two-component system NtrC family response regulator|nr:MAG: response regulator [Candidatus Omnitrophota bacterium]
MLKLLIVEDYELILNEMADNLANQGYAVLKAATGQAAIDLIKEQNPQIIILDLNLKDMSGLQVLREAKAFNPKICVIVLTGFDVETTKEKSFQQGADYFLVKPIPLAKLKEFIAQAAKTVSNNRQ